MPRGCPHSPNGGLGQYLIERHPIGLHGYHRRHGEPQVPNAGQATHPVWVGGDALKRHSTKLPRVSSRSGTSSGSSGLHVRRRLCPATSPRIPDPVARRSLGNELGWAGPVTRWSQTQKDRSRPGVGGPAGTPQAALTGRGSLTGGRRITPALNTATRPQDPD